MASNTTASTEQYDVPTTVGLSILVGIIFLSLVASVIKNAILDREYGKQKDEWEDEDGIARSRKTSVGQSEQWIDNVLQSAKTPPNSRKPSTAVALDIAPPAYRRGSTASLQTAQRERRHSNLEPYFSNTCRGSRALDSHPPTPTAVLPPALSDWKAPVEWNLPKKAGDVPASPDTSSIDPEEVARELGYVRNDADLHDIATLPTEPPRVVRMESAGTVQ